jgi:hypothetical protein
MSRVVSLRAAMEGRVLPLGPAIDEFLADGDFMASTVEVYERTLEALREDLTLIKAKSRHRSLCSLERYVNPSDRAVAALTARHDPNRRQRALP